LPRNLAPLPALWLAYGTPIGTIEDPEFARASFAIWFDPRTSEPVLRRQLLGETP